MNWVPCPFLYQQGHRQNILPLNLFPLPATFLSHLLVLFPTPQAPFTRSSPARTALPVHIQQPLLPLDPRAPPSPALVPEIQRACLLSLPFAHFSLAFIPNYRCTPPLWVFWGKGAGERVTRFPFPRLGHFPQLHEPRPLVSRRPAILSRGSPDPLGPAATPSLPRLPLAAAQTSGNRPARRAHLPRGPAGGGVGCARTRGGGRRRTTGRAAPPSQPAARSGSLGGSQQSTKTGGEATTRATAAARAWAQSDSPGSGQRQAGLGRRTGEVGRRGRGRERPGPEKGTRGN